MEFKGTKGKWKVLKINERFTITSDENEAINFIDCWMGGIGGIETDEEAKANALLISKAPEMLEMLIKLTNSNPIHEGYHELKLQAIQLIKEATEL